jgi:hypothetical protein
MAIKLAIVEASKFKDHGGCAVTYILSQKYFIHATGIQYKSCTYTVHPKTYLSSNYDTYYEVKIPAALILELDTECEGKHASEKGAGCNKYTLTLQ